MNAADLLADADRCVKCGLCLPHCPTYTLNRQEADGPRGRIALTQGLLSGQLAASPVLKQHLDGCLSCRACEAVCPAQVRYGRILDGARSALATPRRTRLIRWISWSLATPARRGLLRAGFWLLARLPAPKRAERWRLWRYRPSAPGLDQPAAPAVGLVALFTGCVGDVLERAVLADSQRLFEAAGVAVAIPARQSCCGALEQHAGLADRAEAKAARNALAFAGCERILPLASGCGAALRDLGGPALAPRVQDLCVALAAALDRQPVAFRPLPLRVAVHSACTQNHVLHGGDAIERLLRRVPGLQLLPLAPASGCCGAAGSQFLSQPAMADRLLAPKIAAVAAQRPDLIVSANIGCALHLRAGLRAQGLGLEVLHPVSLLARALPPAAAAPPPVASAARS